MGLLLVFVFASVYAEESGTRTDDTSGKIITNDDLSRIVLDPDRATVNQMPAASEEEGAGAGGVSSDDSMYDEMDRGKESVEKAPANPGEGSAGGGTYKDSDTWKQDDSGPGKAPVDKYRPDEGGSGMGGSGTDADMPDR